MVMAALAVLALTATGRALAAPGADPAGIHDRLAELERQYDAYIGLFATDVGSGRTGDPRDTSTPRALGIGVRDLLTGTVLGDAQRRQLDQWMRDNVTSSMRAALPPGWTTADKTGAGDYGSTNDIGMVYGPNGQRVLLSLMTRSQSANSGADALRPLIAEVAGSVLPWLTRQG
jgi:beta-lactamase class A